MTDESVHLYRLDPAPVVAVTRRKARLVTGEEARERARLSRRQAERIIDEDRPVYGVTTGFGVLATTHIPPDRRPSRTPSRPRTSRRPRGS